MISIRLIMRLGTAVCGVGVLLVAIFLMRREQRPNPWYIYDGADIQYFAPGPEFKLSREAAAQKAYKADLEGRAVGRAVGNALTAL